MGSIPIRRHKPPSKSIVSPRATCARNALKWGLTQFSPDRALSALESVLAALGEAQLECRCDELAALLALVRRPLAQAREQARFEARA